MNTHTCHPHIYLYEYVSHLGFNVTGTFLYCNYRLFSVGPTMLHLDFLHIFFLTFINALLFYLVDDFSYSSVQVHCVFC